MNRGTSVDSGEIGLLWASFHIPFLPPVSDPSALVRQRSPSQAEKTKFEPIIIMTYCSQEEV